MSTTKVTGTEILYSSGMKQTCKCPRVGTVVMWPSVSAPPAGALPCDGRSLAVSSYPILHSIIGTRYGTTGSGNFNLPNFSNAYLRGTTATNNTSTLSGNWQIQAFAHQHTVGLGDRLASFNSGGVVESGGGTYPAFGYTTSTFTIGANTPNAKTNYIPPFVTFNYVIYHD